MVMNILQVHHFFDILGSTKLSLFAKKMKRTRVPVVDKQKQIIDVEKYKLAIQTEILNIDYALRNEGLCRIQVFKYNVGDCI